MCAISCIALIEGRVVGSRRAFRCALRRQSFAFGSTVMVRSIPPKANVAFGPPCMRPYEHFAF